MGRLFPARRIVGFLFLVLLTFAVVQIVACGNAADPSTFPPGSTDEDGSGGPGPFPPGDDGGGGGSDADPDALGALIVDPPTATIQVTVVDGVTTVNPPQAFTASYNGQKVSATWLFDRGELGDIASSGVFTANGKNVGEGIVTARYGAREGTAKVTIKLTSSQNGGPTSVPPPGPGGYGGVGGDPLGPKVTDAAIINKLKTTGTPPANAAELGFIYPYDKTVWPRGLLGPLLMWQSTRNATAVWVKLSQSNFSFEGIYSTTHVPDTDGGVRRKRVRIEENAWKIATQGNQGDDLKIEVKIYDPANGGVVYGPITETWKVAPGQLKGTVYYNSYDSYVTTGGGAETGGVISIKPRSPNPTLAVPAKKDKCHGCHVVSADGSTLWAQDDRLNAEGASIDDFQNGASYDLTKSPITSTIYQSSDTGQPGYRADNNRKFVWSGPYPDGSFAVASSGWAREAFVHTPSRLFKRSDGSPLTTTGLPANFETVTPAFSPNGRKLAFNFWRGTTTNGVAQGNGHVLAAFDFDCGAPAGSLACSGATYAFTNMRKLYEAPATGYPAWPSFLPDGKAVVFHNTTQGGQCGDAAGGPFPPDPANWKSRVNCHVTTWFEAKAEIWLANDGTGGARRLDALNGIGAGGTSYLPQGPLHANDTNMNYMPTVNPVPSGGYYWVVFTSRRMYGNVMAVDPYAKGGNAFGSPQKKLWVAAIDINGNPANDPSHPAFYLPGQELAAGNARGFWVVDPCKANGKDCETGDECCNGFCRKDPEGGALVCMDQPPGGTCSQEFEKCTVDADCCDPKFKCIAGKCSRPDPIIK